MSAFPPRLARCSTASSPVQQLARLLADAGHECYLVGGSVRDAFLDRALRDDEVVDVDVTTDARPDVVERLVRPWADAVWLQGQRFGTVGCRKDDTRARDHHVPRRGLPPREPQARGRRSPTTSRPTSRGATSPSTRWRCALPDPVLVDPVRRRRSTSPRAACARRSRPRSRSSTTRCACCARRASSRSSASSPIPSSSPRWSSCATGSRS